MSYNPLLYSRIIRSSETPKLVHFLIKYKVVRTETQAVYFLMLIVAMSSVLAMYFFLSLNGGLTRPASLVEAYPISQLP